MLDDPSRDERCSRTVGGHTVRGSMKRPLTLVAAAACLAFVACSSQPPSASIPAGSSPSPTVEPPTTITTPHWIVRYPSDWRVQRLIDACSGALRGVVITETSFAFMPRFDHPCSWRRYGRWQMERFPDDGVAVAVEPASSFPLGGPDSRHFGCLGHVGRAASDCRAIWRTVDSVRSVARLQR
jgi:hypothetical protein